MTQDEWRRTTSDRLTKVETKVDDLNMKQVKFETTQQHTIETLEIVRKQITWGVRILVGAMLVAVADLVIAGGNLIP